MKIIKMTKEHLSSVLKLEESIFSSPWREKAFLEELEKDSSYSFLAVCDDEIIGYCVMSTVLDEGSLLLIAVKEDYRRQGVAKALINKLYEVASKKELSFITLEVRVSNESAIRFYEKEGFEKVAQRKHYYSRPIEDAVLMTKYF